MGSHWLHDLPDIVDASGLAWRTWPGWETRSRSSGGYDQVWAVFVHHTAGPGPQDADCRWEWDATGGDQPIGAINLGRDGTVVIGAAGATNCQGKGGPCPTSHGTIPLDKGNTYGIAIEAGNNGVGEPWPEAQQEAYLVLVAALCDAYNLDVSRDVFAHFEWVEPSCPGRKVDPAGPSRWATGTASWDMAAFRADAALDVPIPEPEPEPEPPEDEMDEADIEAIVDAVWQRQFSTNDGPKAAGWILGQTYGLAQRAVRAAEEAAGNTRSS